MDFLRFCFPLFCIHWLMAYNNEPVTVANLAGTGIYEIHYNKYTNELYLVNGGYRPTTAPASTAETASLRSK